MKLRRSLLILFVMGTMWPVSKTARADPPPPQLTSEAEYRTWAGPAENTQVVEAIAVESCDHIALQRDSTTAGPLHANSDVIVVRTAFCSETNTAIVDIGSIWAGYQGKAQRLWGGLFVRDTHGALVNLLAFDRTSSPDTSGAALVVPLEWLGPWNGREYRFTVEVNLRMLPENTGPNTVLVQWYWRMGQHLSYFPVILNGDTLNACGGYQIRLETAGHTDAWPFKSPGNTAAMLHFGHSQSVTFTWRDAAGNLLGPLPGANQLIRLTWSDLYRDFPNAPAITLQATQWSSAGGPPPWLATSHDLSFQYTWQGTVCRVTIPMIWDP